MCQVLLGSTAHCRVYEGKQKVQQEGCCTLGGTCQNVDSLLTTMEGDGRTETRGFEPLFWLRLGAGAGRQRADPIRADEASFSLLEDGGLPAVDDTPTHPPSSPEPRV